MRGNKCRTDGIGPPHTFANRGVLVSPQADPLQELVVDTRQVSREKLAELLKGRVLLDLDTESFVFVSEARARLGVRKAILVSLLAKKAVSLLKEGVVDAMSPKELAIVTREKSSSIRPALRRLAREGLIVRRPEGYAVHVAAFALVAFALGNKQAS
jgi:hypothetical protein